MKAREIKKMIDRAVALSGGDDSIDIYIGNQLDHAKEALQISGVNPEAVTYSSKLDGIFVNTSLISKPFEKKVLIISSI